MHKPLHFKTLLQPFDPRMCPRYICIYQVATQIDTQKRTGDQHQTPGTKTICSSAWFIVYNLKYPQNSNMNPWILIFMFFIIVYMMYIQYYQNILTIRSIFFAPLLPCGGKTWETRTILWVTRRSSPVAASWRSSQRWFLTTDLTETLQDHQT